MDSIRDLLHSRAGGGPLTLADLVEAARLCRASPAAVQEEALRGRMPLECYRRNPETIPIAQQHTLFRSRAAVIGCGGLGGYIIEELARTGVGTIVAVDPDSFAESNLNRQLLCTRRTIGRAKVTIAARRVREINPAITLIARRRAFCERNGAALLRGSQVVLDALDDIPMRRTLAHTCAALGIPLVHGAVAGWYGQVATQFPGETTLETLFSAVTTQRGVESRTGTPAFLPPLVAALETAEAVKILLGEGALLRRRLLTIDTLSMAIETIPIEG